MKLKQVTDKFSDAMDELKSFTGKVVDKVEKKDNKKTALIVGIACAAVVIVAVAVTVAVLAKRKRDKQLAADNLYDPDIIDSTEDELAF